MYVFYPAGMDDNCVEIPQIEGWQIPGENLLNFFVISCAALPDPLFPPRR